MRSAATSVGGRVERAVLALLLTLTDSETLTIDELLAEIGDRSGTLRALDRLEVVGLIARNDDEVKPTPAARRFDELNI